MWMRYEERRRLVALVGNVERRGDEEDYPEVRDVQVGRDGAEVYLVIGVVEDCLGVVLRARGPNWRVVSYENHLR